MKPLPPVGLYAARVTGQALGTTSKDNIQLVLEILVLGEVNPAKPGEYFPMPTQLRRRIYRVFTEKTKEYVTEDLRTLGFAGDSISQLDPKHPKHWSFVDQEVDVFCGHEHDQNGEMRERWSLARTSAPLVQQDAADDKLRQLDALFRDNLASLKSGGARERPAQPRKVDSKVPVAVGSNLEIDDSDVPF